MSERQVGQQRAQAFLEALSADCSEPIGNAAGVCIVLAHPDDETVGCGAQMSRLRDATLVIATDGAPRDLVDARASGFSKASDYAAARRRELSKALGLAGWSDTHLIELKVPDQEAALCLPELSSTLAEILRRCRPEIVLTHAYEGGHPDHDAVCFAVHAAVRAIRDEIGIVEMPFYRASDSGMLWQRFVDESDNALALSLDPTQVSLKRSLIVAHATQQATLAQVRLDSEQFRPAPDYDFAAPPNRGRTLYDSFGWRMTSRRWLELAGAALTQLRAAA